MVFGAGEFPAVRGQDGQRLRQPVRTGATCLTFGHEHQRVQAVELSTKPDPGMRFDHEDLVVELGHVVALAGELAAAAVATRMLRTVDREHRLLLPRGVVGFPAPGRSTRRRRRGRGPRCWLRGIDPFELPLLDEVLGGGCQPGFRGHRDGGPEGGATQLVAEFRLGDDGHSPDSQSAGKVT